MIRTVLIQERERVRNEARQEGRQEQASVVLLEILGHRFGPVPSGVRERVAAASLAELMRWVPRVLTAASIDAVLGD